MKPLSFAASETRWLVRPGSPSSRGPSLRLRAFATPFGNADALLSPLIPLRFP
ncbi:MAG: hypothetical protein HKN04_14185 [Rhodothermaceae bacterium]|nr:hypothetical protein [Rhodothermaceae bacterium]